MSRTPASQLNAMAAAGVDPERVFVEYASGALDSRPELAKVLAVLRPRDTLVVWRLDRLGRSTSHLIQTVTELGERGIGFHSLTEVIDTTTSAGRLLFGILASLAAFERDVIRERTMTGLAAARAGGKLGGRPPIMTADKIAIARRLLAEGQSKTAVAKTIGVSRPTLYAHLRQYLMTAAILIGLAALGVAVAVAVGVLGWRECRLTCNCTFPLVSGPGGRYGRRLSQECP